ncbi:hypothetical protein [Fibrobacter sp.]|nr:hypothetical protein [Fibrobacter sp.]MBR3072071.1 hypothetical protein [Fibrobacter sp.]
MFIPNTTNAVALAGGGKRKKGAPLGTPVFKFWIDGFAVRGCGSPIKIC